MLVLWTAARVIWSVSALTAVLEYQNLVGSATNVHEQVGGCGLASLCKQIRLDDRSTYLTSSRRVECETTKGGKGGVSLSRFFHVLSYFRDGLGTTYLYSPLEHKAVPNRA